jgi:vesicle-fusing ATPase
MTTYPPLESTVGFLPGLHGEDALGQYWLGQVALRLRREVCWLWRERAAQSCADVGAPLPPTVDRTLAALDLLRYEHDKRDFFAQDATARHLGERILMPQPDGGGQARRGSFGWVVQQLQLGPVECFVLALALLPSVDSAAGPVIATCHNESARTAPTFALAQSLWDAPDAVLRCMTPAHALIRHGLLVLASESGAHLWQAPLQVPALVARQLLYAPDELPAALQPVQPVRLSQGMDKASLGRVAAALRSPVNSGLRLVPVIGAADAPLAALAAAYAQQAGARTVQANPTLPREQLGQALAAAWLRGDAVYLPAAMLTDDGAHETVLAAPPLPGLPLTVFVGLQDRAALRSLPGTLPAIVVPPLAHAERLAHWRAALPMPEAAPLWPELARRFRYEGSAIARVGAELATLGRAPTPEEILAAARADLNLGSLAQPVTPRFTRGELMLPPMQSAQIDEILVAMDNLTRTHYDWGTARAWNEAGLAALFAGPPGTGKTMAAEAIAAELALPLYRIDLSQVVNKYIGETEKNLRRLFDAADASDVILFFDEADALFGKRTEVKDAHDRYANLEISYLLERMERFKGLAILATNRKKDLDEAFIRRLRFVVEFPLPGAAERARIWRAMVPEGVDATEVDVEFLAQKFPLAGGHIRAIVFQACLQSASEGAPRRLTMTALVRAVQREYDKLERANSLDQFGPYAELVASQRKVR